MAATALLSGCAQRHATPALEQIRARGELRVVTINAPTTYYLGAHGPQGFEYRLASSFAHSLGVQLVIEPVLDAAAMRAALAQGRADLAAARITGDAQWQHVGLATHRYGEVPQLIVQARSAPRPRDITSLRDGVLLVREGSTQLDLLQAIRSHGAAGLSWQVQPRGRADPLELVNRGQADYTMIDADEFTVAQHLYPDIEVAFTLPDPRPVQWIVRAGARDLADAANTFFGIAERSGELARIARESTFESRAFDYLDAHRFQSDIAQRLPELRPLFEQAAEATGLDWRLLAAVGYQESKWQREAQSGDGAQGVMMLMSDAATRVGVKDRDDLSENILGGARYLAAVIATLPKHISEPDRTWLALAAYNVGYGHLEDARVLAQMRGKDPDSWADVREQLPLLAQEQWYQRVKRGYARGWEPARFVEQVRQYLAVLEWQDATQLAQYSAADQMVRMALLDSPNPR